MADKLRQASLNRTYSRGQDGQNMTGRTGLLGQDTVTGKGWQREDGQLRQVIQQSVPVQVSLMLNLDENTKHEGKVSASQIITFMLSLRG